MKHGKSCLHCQMRDEIRTRLDNKEDVNIIVVNLLWVLAELVACSTSKPDRNDFINGITHDLHTAVELEVNQKLLNIPAYREATVRNAGGMN